MPSVNRFFSFLWTAAYVVVYTVVESFIMSFSHVYLTGNLRFLPGIIDYLVERYAPIAEEFYITMGIIEIFLDYHGVNFVPFLKLLGPFFLSGYIFPIFAKGVFDVALS